MARRVFDARDQVEEVLGPRDGWQEDVDAALAQFDRQRRAYVIAAVRVLVGGLLVVLLGVGGLLWSGSTFELSASQWWPRLERVARLLRGMAVRLYPRQRRHRQAQANRRIAGSQEHVLGAQHPQATLPDAAFAFGDALQRQHEADRLVEAAFEDSADAFAFFGVRQFRVRRIDVDRQASFAPQVVAGVFVGGRNVVAVGGQSLRQRLGELLGLRDRALARLGRIGEPLLVAPDTFAVTAPVAGHRPAWQRLAGIPFALAELQEPARRKPGA